MRKFFVICERDAGLFSLIQQVISNIPRALNRGYVPVVWFGKNCCYWVPDGYRDKRNVWEYYFEPLIPGYAGDCLPEAVLRATETAFPDGGSVGLEYDEGTYLSNNFGDHPKLWRQVLLIPFMWEDPDARTRRKAGRIMEKFIRPRSYIREKVADFRAKHFAGHSVIGVHLRGTDALSTAEVRSFRKGSLSLNRYRESIERALRRLPDARIFVATDDENSLAAMRECFPGRVLACDSIRHSAGSAEGAGPTGAIMPGYIASDPRVAAQNGEEALVEYLLLCECDELIHNGSSLARTVLLAKPDLPHHNTHRLSWAARLKGMKLFYLTTWLRYRIRTDPQIDFAEIEI